MHRVVADDRTASPKARSARAARRWVLSTLVTCFATAALLAFTPNARAQEVGVDTAAKAMLPEALQKSGVLHAGMEINYAPYQYQVGGKAEGLDADLIRAIAAKLGLKPDFAFVDFPAILPAVQSGRFDVGANFANTAARRKVVSFINYLGFASGLLIQKGNPRKLAVNDLCGRRIAAGVAGFSRFNTEGLSEQCVKDGKRPITIVPLSATDAITALHAGRVDGRTDDLLEVVYVAGQPSGQDLEALALPTVVTAPTLGYITNKDADGMALAQAMATSVNAMIKSGQYAAILRKWKIPEELWLKEAFAN